MSALVAIPVILFSISGYMLFPAIRFSIPFNKSPLIGFSGLFLALYFFALFGIGQTGIIFAAIINVALLAASMILLLKNKSQKTTAEVILPAALFFLLMFFSAFLLRNQIYHEWDELAFWDGFVRSLYITGAKAPTLMHADYPLGISLIQYYFVALTKYSQGIIIFGIFSVIFAAVLYCAPDFSKKTFIYYPILLVFSFFTLYFCGSAIDTICIDGLIGIFPAALIFGIFTAKDHDTGFILQLAILLFFFLSLKTTCIVLAAPVFLVLLTINGFTARSTSPTENREKIKLGNVQRWALKIAIPVAASVLAVGSWEIRNWIVQPMKVFSTSRQTLENFRTLLSPAIAERERKIWQLALEQLFSKEFYSARTSVFILVAVLFFLGILIHILEKSDFSEKFLRYNIAMLAGFIIYTAFLVIFAMFVQEPKNGEQLHSFLRYVGSYMIAWGVSFFAILLWRITGLPDGVTRKFTALIAIATAFYIIINSPLEQIFAPQAPEKSNWVQQKKNYNEFVDVIPQGSTVQAIDLGSTGLSCQILNNLFVGHSYIIWQPCGDPADFGLTKDEFAAYIEASGADYILILHGNDPFWAEFSDMFDYPWHGQAFKVAGYGDYRRVPSK